jgi:hypothetical protein
MKALSVKLENIDDEFTNLDNVAEESWASVCEQFDNDVHRIRDVFEHPPYTALYACYDDDNKPSYYLVEEDRQLSKMRRKVFLNKLGRT